MKGFNIVFISLLTASITISVSSFDIENILDFISFDVPEDANLGFIEIVNKYGFQCEKYEIITEDGYILALFHIIGGCGLPILLMHGIFDSSDAWVIRGNRSMAITLANKGYDVWLGNVRGNKYGRKHVILNPDKDKEFWRFGIDEFASKDLPAIIDFVLNKTGNHQLQAIGHSQGANVFYVLGSIKPEYNRKVKIMISLAPVKYLRHVRGLFLLILKAGPVLNAALETIHVEELLSNRTAVGPLLKFICSNGVVSTLLCENGLIGPVVGYDNREYHDFLSIAFGHFPAGTSRQNLNQQVQVYYKNKLTKYDYGTEENIRLYNSTEPPEYDYSKVTMNTALLVGRNDFLGNIKDVQILRNELPNVVLYKVIDRLQMDHVDFIWGKRMYLYLFPTVFELLTYDYE